jgi:hypothetical protein
MLLMLKMVNGPLPVLVMVMTCAALVVPMFWLPKFSVFVDRLMTALMGISTLMAVAKLACPAALVA